MAGLPRTGNTVLSSILNQNPNIYSSPISPIASYLHDLEVFNNSNETTTRLANKEPLNKTLQNIIENYYQDIDKPIVFDRQKAWATPRNLSLLKQYITPNPKIIVTVRPILEILTSLISIQNADIDIQMQKQGWWYKSYLTENDNRCDFLMQPFGGIDQTLLMFNEMLKPENSHIFHIITYDNLTNNTEQTIKQMYDFLELPQHKHDFNNIKKIEIDNDVLAGYPSNMHEIRPQLKKISQDPKEVLSKYIIDKYSNIGWEGL